LAAWHAAQQTMAILGDPVDAYFAGCRVAWSLRPRRPGRDAATISVKRRLPDPAAGPNRAAVR
jgi:hypothetical protein